MSAPVLEMRGICKTFPGVRALDNVSFEVYAGEMLAIVGQNGAGKSTLMKILSGAYGHRTYEGTIHIDGKKQLFQSPSDAAREGIAMIYQEINMHLDLAVAENLFMGRWKKGKVGRIDWEQLYTQSEEYLKLVGLQVSSRQPVRYLSSSQQQLLSIASALSRSPRILVLDEPTSALTESETENLFRILRELRSQGIASILISHKLNEVFANSDRIVVLRDGKSVATYATAGASRSDVIVAMVGRKLSELYPKSRATLGAVVLDVRDLVVEHPMNAAKNIIDGVSFSVRAGEIVGLAGLVGAGRSELVNAVFGKTPARKGYVSICGTRLERRTPADSIRHGMALVTENRKADGFIGVLSIRHNIALASLRSISRMGKIVRLKEQRIVKAFFDRLSIKALSMDAKVETLSGGNQQKVVVSKWLMTNPRLLILDEPTRGIDVASKFEIYTIMNELAQNNMAIIMISSELEELVSMSDRVLVLADGKIQAEMDAEDCTVEEICTWAVSPTAQTESRNSAHPSKQENNMSRDPSMEQTAAGLSTTQGISGDCVPDASEREILRNLAKQIADLAARPIEEEKRKLWTAHNDLQHTRPLIFCDPENGWNEIVLQSDLKCSKPLMRVWEMNLRKEIFWGTKMLDDKVIEPYFNVPYNYSDTGWGLVSEKIGGEDGGSYTWLAPLKDYTTDFSGLKFPEIHIDYAETEKVLRIAKELFDDILTVRLRGVWWWTLGMTWDYITLRGLENFMLDLYDNPDWVHRTMAFLRDGTLHKLDFLEANGLLALNTEGTYVGSGGFGWTKQLPAPGFNTARVRTGDMWGFAESQETVGVSTEMFEEFIFPYQKPILERFGINCYGCCEPMDPRWEVVKGFPRLRRVSCSPWANYPKMADYLGDKYIFSLKPSPTPLAQSVLDEDYIRETMRNNFRITKDCIVEAIMKDNHTLGKNPQNAIAWCRIAREEAERL